MPQQSNSPLKQTKKVGLVATQQILPYQNSSFVDYNNSMNQSLNSVNNVRVVAAGTKYGESWVQGKKQNLMLNSSSTNSNGLHNKQTN